MKKLFEWLLEGLRYERGEIKVMIKFTSFFSHYILLSYTKAYSYFLNLIALEFTQKQKGFTSEKDHHDYENYFKYYK